MNDKYFEIQCELLAEILQIANKHRLGDEILLYAKYLLDNDVDMNPMEAYKQSYYKYCV